MNTDELTPAEIAWLQEWRRQRALWDRIDLDNPRTDPPPCRLPSMSAPLSVTAEKDLTPFLPDSADAQPVCSLDHHLRAG